MNQLSPISFSGLGIGGYGLAAQVAWETDGVPGKL
jgi:hypothetical protein